MANNLYRSFDVNTLSGACTLWPYLCAPSAPSTGGRTKRVSPPIEKRCRILVVDDEDGFRRSLAFMLKRVYGAVVEEAASGGTALERLASLTGEYNFDLILMDISMPGSSGIEVYKELRRLGVNTLVVFMSAYFTEENQEEASALGVTLLVKPIDRKLLRKIILTCGGTLAS